MAVKHTKVATVADDGTSEVGTNEWNDDHTIDNNTITDAMISSHTTTKITVPTTQLSGTVTNAQLTGSIANTKLATDPLARANHTGSQAQSTVTNLTTDLSSKSPIASPTFTGTVTTASVDIAGNNIDNIQNLIHDTSATTTALDFSGDQLQTISISANTTFTTSNRAIGKSKTIKITTDATLRTLTFPAWKFVGAKPTDQAASKIGILTITCFGTADTDIVAAYAVEE
jgi:hypothetical protein